MNAAWWEPTWLIARREIAERSRAKSFRIVTVVLMLAVAAAVVIPALVGHHHKTEKVGVLGASHPRSPALRSKPVASRATASRWLRWRASIWHIGFCVRARWARWWWTVARF